MSRHCGSTWPHTRSNDKPNAPLVPEVSGGVGHSFRRVTRGRAGVAAAIVCPTFDGSPTAISETGRPQGDTWIGTNWAIGDCDDSILGCDCPIQATADLGIWSWAITQGPGHANQQNRTKRSGEWGSRPAARTDASRNRSPIALQPRRPLRTFSDQDFEVVVASQRSSSQRAIGRSGRS